VQELSVFEGRSRRLEPIGPESAPSRDQDGIGYDSHRLLEAPAADRRRPDPSELAGRSLDADVLTTR